MFRFLLTATMFAGFQLGAYADVVLLYDGNGLPADQPWLFYADDSFVPGRTAVQSPVSGGVQLTTNLSASGGYSNYTVPAFVPKNSSFPVLDRAVGFELNFDAQLISETHSSPDRAGFSVILLGSDSRGIELGFWQGEVWAQTSSFTHGNGVGIDTTVQRNYRLRIIGEDYSLLADGSPKLTGKVQNYPGTVPLPYGLPNYLFLGDDTGSAGANVVLGPIRLNSNLSAVPEPGSLLLCGFFTCCVAIRRKR